MRSGPGYLRFFGWIVVVIGGAILALYAWSWVWNMGPKVYGLHGRTTLFVFPEKCAVRAGGVPVWRMPYDPTPEQRKEVGGELMEVFGLLPDFAPWCSDDSLAENVMRVGPGPLIRLWLIAGSYEIDVVQNVRNRFLRRTDGRSWRKTGEIYGLHSYLSGPDNRNRRSHGYIPIDETPVPYVIECAARHPDCRGRLDLGDITVLVVFSPKRLRDWKLILTAVNTSLNNAIEEADRRLKVKKTTPTDQQPN